MRKFLKIAKSLMLCVALTVSEIKAQDTMIVRVSLRVSDFRFDTLKGYDFISSKDNRVAYLSEHGKPMLPVFVPTYIIPYWKTVSYCEVVSKDSVQVPGFWKIYPAQSSSDTSWVPPDSAVYYSDSLYPGIPTGNIDLGSFDGAVLARPQANVFQYRPLSGKLFLYTEITLKLVFKDSEPPINAKERYAHVQAIYDDMLSALTENDEAIGAWYRRPVIIEPGSRTMPDVFAIITTANQMDEAAQYADWTDRRGYPTIVVDVANIIGQYGGRNPAEDVFNWIQAQYQEGLSFVLFLGYEEDIPYRYLTYTNLPQKPDPPYDLWQFVPSDLYFSSVSCAVSPGCALKPLWDCDEDQVYGEPGPQNGLPPGDAGSWDHYPEVFVGRVLAYTDPVDGDPNEAQNWVDKTLKYEKDPGNAGNLTKVKFIFEEISCPRCEETKDYYPDDYYFTDLYHKPSREVLDTLSTKPCGWVNIYSHGEPSMFWTRASPLLRNSLMSVPDVPGQADLSELANQDKYFLVYSISCFQEAFESGDSLNWPFDPPYRLADTTISEGFVEAYPLKGAVAFLGNARPGVVGGSHDLHHAFLDCIFGPLATPNRFILGVPEAYSKAQANINPVVAREHNLQGSPVIDIWDTTAPRTIYTQHPSSIPSGQQNFTVRVLVSLKPLVPLMGAMVSVKGCNVYDFDTTDINGYVTFSINPQGPGIMKVTATKHNHKPRESNCQVLGKGSLATSEVGDMPIELSLKTCYSRGQVKIAYAIPPEDEGRVSLKIYDVAGRETDNLLDAETQAGWYEAQWRPPTSGVYILVLRTQTKVLTCRIVSVGR